MREWLLIGLALILLAATPFLVVPAPEDPGSPAAVSPDGLGLPGGGTGLLVVAGVLLLGLGANLLLDPGASAGPRSVEPPRRLGVLGLAGVGLWVMVAVGTSAGFTRLAAHLGVSRFALVAGGSASLQAVFLLAGLVLWRRTPGALPRFGRGSHRDWAAPFTWGILGYLRVYPLILLAMVLNLFLLRFVGLADGTPRALQFLSTATTPLQKTVVLVLVLAGAPLAEELFFRGLVHRMISEWTSRGIAAILSGGLFALVHFDPLVVFPLWVLGWVLARWYDRSGSLLVVVVMHACQNGLSLLLFWTMLSG